MDGHTPTAFDHMLAKEMRNPEFRDAFEHEMQVIATVQMLLKLVDERRRRLGLSKAELARRAG